jgi:hypothetical protein
MRLVVSDVVVVLVDVEDIQNKLNVVNQADQVVRTRFKTATIKNSSINYSYQVESWKKAKAICGTIIMM